MALLKLFAATAALLATCLAQQYSNPVLWEDLADNDVFRVNDGNLAHLTTIFDKCV